MDKIKFHASVISAAGRIDKRTLEKQLKLQGLYETVSRRFPNDLVESYYWFYHDLKDYPKKCKVCKASLTKFGGFHKGYLHETCSPTCAALDIDKKQKASNTLLKKLGVAHQMHADSVVKKVKDTCSKKYGVNCGLQTPAAKQSLKEKYGVDFISQSEHWKKSTTETFNIKYGGRGFSGSLNNAAKETLANELNVNASAYSYHQLAAWANSKRKTYEKCAKEGFELLEFDAPSNKIKLKHSCGAQKELSFLEYSRFRCFSCNPLCQSTFEMEVGAFIKSLGVNILTNDRKIISPLELDIVIPDFNIAIECNGDYWHSYTSPETKDERNKHLHKMEVAGAAGYQLIQIAEHEWFSKTEQIKSIIAVKLGRAKVLYARKMEIRRISSNVANIFCDKNHVQGKAPHSLALGGFIGDELVAVITAGKNRFTKTDDVELIRFSTKLNTVIVGGFSKMIKHLKREIGGVPIDSYLDRRLFDGHSLFKTGWELVRTSQPGYCWLYKGEKINRSKTQKQRLQKILGDQFDPNKSEAQNMFDAGASRLWDCGQHLFRLP